jgi:hypothetical protein
MFLAFPFNIIFTIILAFFSHVVFDAVSVITYHTPDIQKEDKFWLVWHVIIYALSILSVIIFIVPYWLSLIFANIHDIWDWYILRPIQRKREKKGLGVWGENLYFHSFVDRVRDTFFNWLPRWNYRKGGIIIEILVIIGFFIWILFLDGFSFIF